MPDWLNQTFHDTTEVPPSVLALRLVAAVALGYAVSLLYRLVRRNHTTSPSFPSTLVLLAILIAMVTQVIGDHIARAFSLVGALSIVRFRTVVEDTLDIAFVIFAVVLGMAVGANHLQVALLGYVIVGIAALATQQRRSPSPWVEEDSRLTVRVGIGRSAETVLREPLATYCSRWTLLAGSTSQKGAAVELTYRVRLRPGISPADTIDALNRLEGVQSVELRREA
jgi:hypothetical protein